MPQFVLFFLSIDKKTLEGFFLFEFRRLILICSRQDVHFDKGLLLFELRFCSFLYILFAPLFFLSFFAMLLAILLALHEEYGI